MNEPTRQRVVLASINIEQASLFLLTCDALLFNDDVNRVPLRDKRKALKEKYRCYTKAVFNGTDIAREEKINQIKDALEGMLTPASELVDHLTERGLHQLHANLQGEPRYSKKKKGGECPALKGQKKRRPTKIL